MDQKITATQLAKSLSDVLNRVKYRGERFIIERNGEPIATLAPTAPRGVTLNELIAVLGDWHPPGDGYADDLEWAQANQGKAVFPEWPNS